MSTTQPANLTTAFASMRDFIRRLTAPTQDTSELWQLYRMARGSDSMRPALVRKLAASAGRR